MCAYQSFALLYDELMNDVPYEKWLHYIENVNERYGNGGRRLLDIGCGTGAISIPLALSGYEVTGVDVSEEMLAVANEKAEETGVNIAFFQQDMRELDGFEKFDCIGIFCDSLNYLLTEDDVKETFARVFKHLSDGGLFLFDVHSLYKVEEIFIGNSYCSNDEHISYIWNCYQGEAPYEVEHELTFFVEQDGLYERFDELHNQRTFSIDLYEQWLAEQGFEIITITADFTEEKPQPTSERIFFCCRKK